MYVHGQNLIRARDLNLPVPVEVTYPVYDQSGINFLGTYYNVPSFSTWQMSPSLTCPFPTCINPLARPISQLGAINEFDSAASSTYHGQLFLCTAAWRGPLLPTRLHLRPFDRRWTGCPGRRSPRDRSEFLFPGVRARSQRD